MNWDKDKLIDVKCDNCNLSIVDHVYRRPDDLDIVKCRDCGLHFLNPRPRPDFIFKLYSEDYFRGSNGNPTGYLGYDAASHAVLRRIEARRRLLIARTLGVSRLGSTLEVGCSTGDLAAITTPLASDFTGIDISEHAIRIARQRAPASRFFCGQIDEVGPAAAGPFDTILSFEVIEHVLSPQAFIKSLAERLKSDGYLVLSTPNADCGIRLGFDNWLGARTSFEHLFFFRLEDLDRLAQNAGLSRVAAATGCGSGRFENSTSKHSVARRLALALGMRRWIWTLREWRLSKKQPPQLFDYEDNLEHHNIFALYRKTQICNERNTTGLGLAIRTEP